MVIKKLRDGRVILTTNAPGDGREVPLSTGDFETKEGKFVLTDEAKKRLRIKEAENGKS